MRYIKSKPIFWWVLVFLWCALIYNITATPAFTGAGTRSVLVDIFPLLNPSIAESLNFYIRKLAHVTEFGILALLIWKAMGPVTLSYFKAWLLASFYGAFDEIHQSFVPGRDGRVMDVLLDSVGALAAVLILYFIGKLYVRRRLKISRNQDN